MCGRSCSSSFMETSDLYDTSRFFPALEADALRWLHTNGLRRFRDAAKLRSEQAQAIQYGYNAWVATGAEDTPLEKVIFTQRRLVGFEYTKDATRGKLPLRASKTFELMRGDCKDFAVLAAAMLLALGLKPVIELHAAGEGHNNHVRCHEPITGITLEKSAPEHVEPRVGIFACLAFRLDADE